jgi:hypothetical protein
MLWRYQDNKQYPMDFNNVYHGSIALIGGAPNIKTLDLSLLAIPTWCINNSASLVKHPTFSCHSDMPGCFYPEVLTSPLTMKFINQCRWKETVNGVLWRDITGTLFYPTHTNFTPKTILDWWHGFPWTKDIVSLSISLLYYLGFRKIYLLGCRFKLDEKDYAWEHKLTDAQREWNRRTYLNVVNKLISYKSVYESHGLQIISCTEDSLLNTSFPVITFDGLLIEEAVKQSQVSLKHSSEFAK